MKSFEFWTVVLEYLDDIQLVIQNCLKKLGLLLLII